MNGRMPGYDVAIVGCGPVGAAAANLFGAAGLRTVVIEKRTEPYPLPRAVHIDHEMMRVFQSVALAENLLPLMREGHGHIHIGADGGVIRYLGSASMPKRFGWANDYFFYQPELEQALIDALARFPHVELRAGAELSGIAKDGDGVTLSLASGETISARYTVACDGASSFVRKALGIRLLDMDFEEPWLVVDAEVDGPIKFPAFAGVPPGADLQHLSVMLCDPRRPATLVPGRGKHRRWEFMLLPGESDEAMMQPERVAQLVAPYVAGVPHQIVRAATYRFHGLVAERWQDGCIFLAGDAAHQTPPFFGQGMCHGIRDVANLAWKLAAGLRGEASARLLDSYQPERDPHVRAVIGAAIGAGRYICERDPQKAAQRDAELRAQMGNAVPRSASDLIPPIAAGIVDPEKSPATGARFIQPRVEVDGKATLLDDATGQGFRLIALSEDVAASIDAKAWRAMGGKTVVLGRSLKDTSVDLAAWLTQHEAKAVLLRPDFYVYGTAKDAPGAALLVSQLQNQLKSA